MIKVNVYTIVLPLDFLALDFRLLFNLEDFSSCSWADAYIGFFIPDISDSYQVPCFFFPLGTQHLLWMCKQYILKAKAFW